MVFTRATDTLAACVSFSATLAGQVVVLTIGILALAVSIRSTRNHRTVRRWELVTAGTSLFRSRDNGSPGGEDDSSNGDVETHSSSLF